LFLLSVAVVLLVSVLTLAVVLRRGVHAGEDLVASQMRPDAAPRSARRRRPVRGRQELPPGVDDATWRRIGELAVAGRRVQAIEMLRTATGCHITEAKAVVDRLSRAGRP
jgi:hypothetical protein